MASPSPPGIDQLVDEFLINGFVVLEELIPVETIDAIYLRTAERIEIRIPRDEVRLLNPVQLSIMPQGLEKGISREELRDLITYLSTLRDDKL